MKKLAVIFSMLLIFAVTIPTFAAEFSVQVNSSASSINFRTSPSKSSGVITEIPDGTVLRITNMVYDNVGNLIFGQTKYSGVSGWVSLRQTTITEFNGIEATVSGNQGSINFRTSASTASRVIAEIPNGTKLYISDMVYNSSDDFFFGKTIYNGASGWVSLRQTIMTVTSYSQANSSAGPAMAGSTAPWQASQSTVRTDVGFNGNVTVKSETGSINFRTIPSTSADSNIICEIPHNTVLTIEDIVTNEGLYWGLTTYNGYKGWVSLRHTATPFHTYSMPEYVRPW